MSHYFTNEETADVPSTFQFDLGGKTYRMQSNAGVFSRDKLDEGTRILLETVLEQAGPAGPVLDLGCGIGPVAKVMATEWHVPVTAIDVNERAVGLTKKNTAGLDVTAFVQDGLEEKDGLFGTILLNPPIRTGKETIYRLFAQCVDHLKEDGSLWIVMRKQHGAASAVQYLEGLGARVERVNRDKGFWILKVNR